MEICLQVHAPHDHESRHQGFHYHNTTLCAPFSHHSAIQSVPSFVFHISLSNCACSSTVSVLLARLLQYAHAPNYITMVTLPSRDLWLLRKTSTTPWPPWKNLHDLWPLWKNLHDLWPPWKNLHDLVTASKHLHNLVTALEKPPWPCDHFGKTWWPIVMFGVHCWSALTPSLCSHNPGYIFWLTYQGWSCRVHMVHEHLHWEMLVFVNEWVWFFFPILLIFGMCRGAISPVFYRSICCLFCILELPHSLSKE